MGKVVTARNNGVWCFDTRFGDTLFINTAAGLGASWRFYDDTGSRYFIATVTSKGYNTIAGITDSIKTISIHSYVNGVAVSDSVDGLQIQLSKLNGLLYLPDLHSFPYSNNPASPNRADINLDYYISFMLARPVTNPYSGIQNQLSKANLSFTRCNFHYPEDQELFPQIPGSVYHYKRTGYYDYSYQLLEIDSIGYDNLVYCRRWQETPNTNGPGTYTAYSTFTRSGLFLGSLHVDTSLLPETPRARIWYYYPRQPSGGFQYGAGYQYRSSWNRIMPGLFQVNTLEPCAGQQNVIQIDTLGTISQEDCHGVEVGTSFTNLVYARIENNTYGTPLAVTPSVNYEQEISWRFTNNGHTLQVNLPYLSANSTLELFNISGQRVYQLSNPTSTEVDVPVGHLPCGIYLLSIHSRENTQVLRISLTGL